MNWLIIGAGVSGLGAAKLLRREGASVRVSEGGLLAEEKAASFRRLGVDLREGGHKLDHLHGIEGVVASPGLPWSHPLIKEAFIRNIPIVSEIDLALERFKGRVIAVTGTNGKSTTCAMLAHMLKAAGRSYGLGGNFGDPPTAMLAEDRLGKAAPPSSELLVLELSSYQLEQSNLVAPVAAIFTSFSHDHIARHGSLGAYLAAKWKIFAKLEGGGVAVLPAYVAKLARDQGFAIPEHSWLYFRDRLEMEQNEHPGFLLENDKAIFTDDRIIDFRAAGIFEPHNQLNAAYAMCSLKRTLGCRVDDMPPLLKGFRALPHRCEPIGTIGAHGVINDSKSTNVESTLVALASQRGPVILMMGGQGKNEPYDSVLSTQADIKAVVTFGTSGHEIADALAAKVPIYRFQTLAAAMTELSSIYGNHAASILFSPGCASFDEFKNYEDRGRYFSDSIKKAFPNLK